MPKGDKRSKRIRRQQLRGRGLSAVTTPAASPSGATQPRPAKGPVSASSPVVSPVPQDPARYRYVIQELKKIGIIAGGLIAILIILSFVLR